jgi:hypothetical protein
MAIIIKPKRSGSSDSVPTTGDLADGEIAINTADQKIYARSSSSIVNLGTGTTASAAELNILDGATISTAELNAAVSTGKSIAMSIVFGSG